MFTIYQGDAFSLPIKLKAGQTVITDINVSEVEIVLANIRKTFTDGGIGFDSTTNCFTIVLTQQDTFKFPVLTPISAQVRVKFTNNAVRACKIENVLTVDSLSQEVL